MGTFRSLRDYSLHLQVVAERVGRNAESLAKEVPLLVDRVAVISTPVDTSLLKNNWQVSRGAPAEGVVDVAVARDSGAAELRALQQAEQAISRFDGEGTVFIVNNVPYGPIVDSGTSAFAPNGMTRPALAAGRELIRRRQKPLLQGL